jgi:hypothetical protein
VKIKKWTKVPIVQPFDARPQKSDCHTLTLYKTELFDVVEGSVVGKFRDSSHDHGEDEI